MPKLFEITEDLRALDDLLEECEGDLSRAPEIEPAVVAWFEQLTTDEGKKLDGYCNLIKQLESEASTARTEAAAYASKASSRDSRVKYLKQRLQMHLELTKRTKAATATGRTISIVNNGGNAPVVTPPDLNLADVPERFVKVTKVLDTDAVREELKAGSEFPFARLGDRGTHLRIK